jgi:hypothetical protein
MDKIYIRQLWANDDTTSKFDYEGFETKLDRKYLNVGEKISQNLDLNMNKIIKVALPQDQYDGVNKLYSDRQIIALRNELSKTDIQVQNTLNYGLKRIIGEDGFRALQYFGMMNQYKPALWISAFNPHNFIGSSENGIKCLMESAITLEGDIRFNSTDLPHGKALLFKHNRQRIISDDFFSKDYTFFFVASKMKKTDHGRLFTSTIDGRSAGWHREVANFKLGNTFQIVKAGGGTDTDLHMFIVSNHLGHIDFWDCDEKITAPNALPSGSIVSTEDF